jgi:hypothetical protein
MTSPPRVAYLILTHKDQARNPEVITAIDARVDARGAGSESTTSLVETLRERVPDES